MHKYRNQADGVDFAPADAAAGAAGVAGAAGAGAAGVTLVAADSAGMALSSFCDQGSVLSVVLSLMDFTYSAEIGAAALPHSDRM